MSICAGCGKEYVGFSPHDFCVESGMILHELNELLIVTPRDDRHTPFVERLLAFKENLSNTRLVQVKQ